MPVGAGVAGIQQFHGPDVDLAALQGQAHQFVNAVGVVQGGGHGFMNKRIDGLVLLAQDAGMVRVGGQALDAIDKQFAQTADIGIEILVGHDPHAFPLGHHARLVAGRGESCRSGRYRTAADLGFELIAVLDALLNQGDESVGIEVHVGQRGKYGLTGVFIDIRIADAGLAGGHGDLGKSFDGVDQKILKHSHIGLLAADADFGAAFAFCRLFALKTKHGVPP